MAQTVIGIFDRREDAEDAVDELLDAGFSRGNIDLSGTLDDVSTGTTGTGTGSAGLGDDMDTSGSTRRVSGSSDGTSSGATGSIANMGAVSDSALGSAGTSAMQGSSAMAGTSSMGGSTTNSESANMPTSTGIESRTDDYTADNDYDDDSSHGKHKESGIAKFFKNLFGSGDDSDDEADRYTRAGERGTIVTVHTETRQEAEHAASILDTYGADNVNDGNRSFGNDSDDVDQTRGTASQQSTQQSTQPTMSSNNETGGSIPVIEENLQVGKKEVETGGVRLRSRIVERPVEEHLRLREERVRVKRNPVDRPATAQDGDAFQERTVELTERAEVPVVSKETRVVEEVSLGKEVEHKDQAVRDTVRKTEVDVEQVGKNEDHLGR